MGTGIVSEALALDGHQVLSKVWLALTGAIALGLLAAVEVAVRTDPRAVARGAATPASLTVVAALGVLGTRLTQDGSRAAGVALLALAVACWAPLLPRVLRAWRRPAGGGVFLVSVATQAIAVLCATLGFRAPAMALLAAGLALYAFALAWLPVLVAGEAARPRRRFDARRWSTVFPVGMYAAMSHAVGITTFSRAWARVAVAVWAVVAAGSVRAPDRPLTRRWPRPRAPERMAP